jgi:hypothetical protein
MDTPNTAVDLLERDIAERLKPVCGHMSPESFKELVKDIVRVKVKYGLESLPTEQLHGAIADVVLQATSEVHEDEKGPASR